MLPRIGIFKADRMRINHIVMVDGETMKPLCIRMPLKHGRMMDSEASVTCDHCKNKGWTKSLGAFGVPVENDKHGRYIARQTEE